VGEELFTIETGEVEGGEVVVGGGEVGEEAGEGGRVEEFAYF